MTMTITNIKYVTFSRSLARIRKVRNNVQYGAPYFIPSVYPSHVARSEDAGLPKSFSMVSKVFKSTVNNLLFFFSQTQVLYLLPV